MEKIHEQSTNITHDFMRVESFSQLPFIRPPPPTPPPGPLFKDKPVRLFGIEFNGTNLAPTNHDQYQICTHEEVLDDDEDLDMTAANVISNIVDSAVAAAGDEMSMSISISTTATATATATSSTTNNRKFECHYCCRNFPTSQALGGHQNAHKRERQHAKRVHLQSASVLHGALGGWPTSPTPPSSIAYHSRRLYENHHNQHHHGSYYSHHHHHQPPINGSPLGLWRIPSVQTSSTYHHHRDRPPVLIHNSMPVFTDLSESTRQPTVLQPQSLMMGGSVGKPNSLRYFYDSKPPAAAVQDHHVSLDLHL